MRGLVRKILHAVGLAALLTMAFSYAVFGTNGGNYPVPAAGSEVITGAGFVAEATPDNDVDGVTAPSAAVNASITLTSFEKFYETVGYTTVDLKKPVLYTNDHFLQLITPIDSSGFLTFNAYWHLEISFANHDSIIWQDFEWHMFSIKPRRGSYFLNQYNGEITEGTETTVWWWAYVPYLPAGDAKLKIYYNGQVYKTYSIVIKTGVDPSYIKEYNQGNYSYKGDYSDKEREDILANKNVIWINSDNDIRSIAKIGCALTSCCMMLSYYGVYVEPSVLNVYLKNHGGYNSGNIDWNVVCAYAKETEGVLLSHKRSITDAELAADGGYFGLFGPQIMHVKWKQAKHEWGHWVLATGWDKDLAEDKIRVFDPNGGCRDILLNSNTKYRVVGPNGKLHNEIRAFYPKAAEDIVKALEIRLHSPAELLITDAQGRRTGYDPVSGQTYNEIPNAYYDVEAQFDNETDEFLDETKVLELENADIGQYTLKVIGTDAGTYELEIYGMNNSFTKSEIAYQNIPTALNYTDTYQLQYDNAIDNFEAESMSLSNYVAVTNADASNENLAEVSPLSDSGPTMGNVNFYYSGTSGEKDITVWYFDTTEGQASYQLYINDVLKDEWTAAEDSASYLGVYSRDRRTLSNIYLNNGDRIMIQGVTEKTETAALDNVEISPALVVEQKNPAAPTFTPKAGIYDTPQSVSLASPTKGTAIYYTTDGTTPTVKSPVYKGPASVTKTTTIKAYSAKAGMTDSLVATAEYKIQVLTPTFSAAGNYDTAQNVAISCETADATIYYTTDGADPTRLAPVYTGPFLIDRSTTIKAYAVKPGLPDSETASTVINIKAAAPEADPDGGIYGAAQTVTLTSSTVDATIRYTVDGTTPDSSSALYTGSITVSKNTTIKAYAAKTGIADSEIMTEVYDIQVAEPIFSPDSGEYTGGQKITLTCADSEATIIYTVDGTDPVSSVTAQTYTGPIEVDSDATIMAYAVKNGFMDSGTVTADYYLQYKLETPVFVPSGGFFSWAQDEITITCATGAATIKYTTDGSDPATSATALIYNGPLALPDSGVTVKACAIMPGLENSDVNAQTYIYKVVPPINYPDDEKEYDEAQHVFFYCFTEGATIKYTTDGSDPTTSATAKIYSGELLLISTDTTIKAYGVKEGMTDSDVVTANYSINLSDNVSAPTFSPEGGTYTSSQNVTIVCETSGAIVRYTTDGSVPNTLSSVYTGPITVTANTTVSAYAVKFGLTDSAVATAVYKIKAATPTFNIESGAYETSQVVELACATEGATIRYTVDGTTPTETSAIYTGPITVAANTTISAYAVKFGLTDSAVATAVYKIKVATPTFSVKSGSYSAAQTVKLACATKGATIRYTVDGTTPTKTSAVYNGSITVAVNKTISAYAVKAGLTDSAVATAVYKIKVATPTFSVKSGSYSAAQTVKLACATKGATIRYTVDGTTPTKTSAVYNGSITVAVNKTINAYAAKAGLTDSAVATAVYKIKVATPTFSIKSGSYGKAQTVKLTCATKGATIRYTVDGTTPTKTSAVYTRPITVAVSMRIKAYAILSGLTDSSVATAVYNIK